MNVPGIRRSRRGFTLIELLIVVAIIGIIAALLVPNLLDSLQKSKQKRTMLDERNVGNSMMAWLTDNASAAAAGASGTVDLGDWTGTASYTGITSALVPMYIQKVPERDGWKETFFYRVDLSNPRGEKVFLVASGGSDRSIPGGVYTAGAFDPTDYEEDIIWADGFFVRWPQRQQP